MKLLTFLRDDIYDEMAKGSSLFDAHDSILTLDWKDGNNYSIRRMMAARIATYFKDEIPEQFDKFDFYWELIFPRDVIYLSYGQTKTIYTNQYIIERTFNRPREFLQYCRLILEKTQTNNLPVPYDSVIGVESAYCDWKMTDTIGEFSSTYDNLENCIYSFASVTKDWKFSYIKLSEHIATLSDRDLIFDKIRKQYIKGDELIKLLYRIGFLRKALGAGRYITYGMEKHINPKTCRFDIHPAFRKKLIGSSRTRVGEFA